MLLALVLLVGDRSLAQDPVESRRPPALAGRVAALVAGCGDGPAAQVELLRELVTLRPVPVAAFFELLESGSIPADWGSDAGASALREEQRQAIRGALLAARPAELHAFLEGRLERRPDLATRRLALDVLGRFGERDELDLAVRYATVRAENGTVARPLREDLTKALVHVLARDESAYWGIRACFERAPSGLSSSIVRALGESEPERALGVASSLLGVVPGVDALLLGTIARLAEAVDPPVDIAVAAGVRPYLASSDPHVAQVAAKASGRLEDYDAIPGLIRLLEERDENVRATASHALAAIGRVRLGDDPDVWTTWYERELDWWESDATRTMSVAANGEPAAALQAILELSRKCLFRQELVAGLAPAVLRPQEPLALTACAVLGQLGSPAACRALLPGLDHDLATVRQAAAAALHRATGLDLPPDPEAWSAVLEGR